MQIMSKVTTNLTRSKLEYDKLDKKCTLNSDFFLVQVW